MPDKPLMNGPVEVMFSLVLAGVVPRVTTSRAENVCIWCTLLGAVTFWIAARLILRSLAVSFGVGKAIGDMQP